MQPVKLVFQNIWDTHTTGICTAQTAAEAGDLNINGTFAFDGVAYLSRIQKEIVEKGSLLGDEHADAIAYKVAIHSTLDDTGTTFTIYGVDASNRPISEEIAGPNNSNVFTTNYFLRVTRIAVNKATTGSVSIGIINNVYYAASPIVVTDWRQSNFKASLSVKFENMGNGSATITVQNTVDDPEASDPDEVWYAVSGLNAITANAQANIVVPVRAVRMSLDKYTAPTDGSIPKITFTYIQSGDR